MSACAPESPARCSSCGGGTIQRRGYSHGIRFPLTPFRRLSRLHTGVSTGADMKRTVYFAAFAALVVSCEALAVGGIAQVTIIDRRSGLELTPYLYHGEYWVAGSPGATYAIEIRNRLGERILAVTSVDGVNVISGATAGWNQTGYVFDAAERYQIS